MDGVKERPEERLPDRLLRSRPRASYRSRDGGERVDARAASALPLGDTVGVTEKSCWLARGDPMSRADMSS